MNDFGSCCDDYYYFDADSDAVAVVDDGDFDGDYYDSNAVGANDDADDDGFDSYVMDTDVVAIAEVVVDDVVVAVELLAVRYYMPFQA